MIRWLRPLLAVLFVIAFVSLSRGTTVDTPAPTGNLVVQYTAQADQPARDRIAAQVGAVATPRIAPELLQRAAAKSTGGSPALDALGRYVQFDTRHLADQELRRLAARLAHDPAVARAFLEPRAVPAALGFDAFTGQGPANGGLAPADVTTDDLTEWQGYMWEPPQGIGAWLSHAQPGGRGQTVRITDIEGAWLWDHEDLPEPFADLGQHFDDLSWRNHGTAVMGEMGGLDNGYGVTGIVPDAAVGNSSVGSQSVAQALFAAAAAMEPGDVLLIELHAPGPNANGDGQYGYVPMEFWPDNFDAIRAITDLGYLVVEAAGNGQQDLDDAIYQDFFDRSVRDSGAIMVGATSGSSMTPAWFTNHGTRVDLCGWGSNVATCGYGDLQGGDEIEWYTVSFSGTSSASPIVTGAVASLQGMAETTLGLSLDAYLARQLLVATGTPSNGPELIGPRPDLVAARDLMITGGVGAVAGTVTDAVSGRPVADAVVGRLADGTTVTTDATGHYRLGLLPGPHTIWAESYFHVPETHDVVITAGAETTLDLDLDLRELTTIGGRMVDANGDWLPDVTMELLDQPVATTVTGEYGLYAFEPIPAQDELLIRAGGLPGYGGQIGTLVPIGIPDLDGAKQAQSDLYLPPVTYDFEDGQQGWTAYGGLWTLGDPVASGMGDGAAFDGSQCWGVGLDGSGYPDETWAELWSPVYTDADHEGHTLTLSFHYWCATEPGFDGVHVVLDPGAPGETVLVPYGGYTDPILGGLGHQSGWSGESGGWRTAVFDLSEQLDADTWQLAIRFGSDQSLATTGFLVDGITLAVYDYPTAADTPAVTAAALSAHPNPFNPQVTLSWRLPEAGRLDLAVFDLRGRLVSHLLRGEAVAAAGQLNWNGTDQGGRAVASGVYLVRARSHQGHTAQQRITLTR